MNNLKKEIEKLAYSGKADIIGFTALEDLPDVKSKGYNTGITIAVALDKKIIKDIKDGPTLEYFEEYKKANSRLDNISRVIAEYLNEEGFLTDYWGATDDRINGEELTTELPHKTLATLSGIGWIGKCALLITKKYGSAVRLTSVLTSTEIASTNRPVIESNCGRCDECVKRCPGKAVKDINWDRTKSRLDFFDPFLCRVAARKLAEERTGLKYTFCGICMASCPYTLKYLNCE